jgi:ketosteroid isomerase-like protein
MSVEENKALVRRRYDEIENRHDIDAADELMTVDYVHQDPVLPPEMQRDRDGFKQMIAMLLSAVPDLHTTVHEPIAEGTKSPPVSPTRVLPRENCWASRRQAVGSSSPESPFSASRMASWSRVG